MAIRRLAITVLGLGLAGMIVAACGAPVSKPRPSNAELAACTRLNGQTLESVSHPGGWTSFYDVPPSLVNALHQSGNATLEKIGGELAVDNSPNHARSFNSVLERGKALCHSLSTA